MAEDADWTALNALPVYVDMASLAAAGPAKNLLAVEYRLALPRLPLH